MTGSDASSGEMPGFPLPSRSGREPDEPLLDMILNGQPLPAHAPHGMLALADTLASLGSPAGQGKVPGEVAAMAAFGRSAAGASASPAGREPVHRKPSRRRPLRLRTAYQVRLAGGIFVVTIGLGSAAAYADVLPAPVQDFAHHVIGAPPAPVSDGRSGEHQTTTHRPGTHAPGSGRHQGQLAKPGQAKDHGKAASPGKAKGKARHVHRANPKKPRAGKPTHPAHPTPSHPVRPTATPTLPV